MRRIHQPSPAEFETLAAAGEPVVLTGLLDDWKALKRWTTQYLTVLAGVTEVRVSRTSDGFFMPDEHKRFPNTETMEFYRFLKLVDAPEEHPDRVHSMLKMPLRAFPLLARDFAPPTYIADRLTADHLWIAEKNAVTPVHYDVANNLLAQVRGRKRLRLFAPNEQLYPFPLTSPRSRMGRVTVDAPDRAAFPGFKPEREVECVIEPGEVLFIPIFWWHQVHNLDTTIAVNFWWGVPWSRMLAHRLGWRHLARTGYRHARRTLTSAKSRLRALVAPAPTVTAK